MAIYQYETAKTHTLDTHTHELRAPFPAGNFLPEFPIPKLGHLTLTLNFRCQDRLYLSSMQCRQLVGVFGDSESRIEVGRRWTPLNKKALWRTDFFDMFFFFFFRVKHKT